MMLRGILAASAMLLGVPALAQDADESALDAFEGKSVAAVQPAREPVGAAELRAAIRRISYNSADADALADAGNAALALGDANAALNFFTRANAARPNNGRILAGLAAATVRTENPFEALRLFDQAVKLGVSERAIAAERGLAFDLLGNFARAQQDYSLAKSGSTSDEIIIKQAISLSLAGQKQEADAMLVPLLDRNQPAAWRARAFMLAARGDYRESTKVAQGFLDAASAQRMERYFRQMPDLTPAQQAAAIHLGHFPASQYVGRDSEQLRRVAATIPPVQATAAESKLIPTGEPLGTKTAKLEPRKKESRRERKARDAEAVKVAVAKIPDSAKLPKTDPSRLGTETARARMAEVQTARVTPLTASALPAPETARPLISALPPVASTNQPSSNALPAFTPPAPAPAPSASPPVQGLPSAVQPVAATVAPASQQLSAPTVVTANAQPVLSTALPPMQGPSLTGSPVAAVSSPVTSVVVPSSVPSPAPAATAPAFDLAAIVSAIEIPESEQTPSAVPVDLTRIKPAASRSVAAADVAKTVKADSKAAAKPKLEAHPARFWVQIATGDAKALGFDYRKWTKKSAELFKGQKGWTSEWGRTDRLLVGPFADQKAAKKWEGDFRKAGGDGFMWKSENGVVVTALSGK